MDESDLEHVNDELSLDAIRRRIAAGELLNEIEANLDYQELRKQCSND